MYGWKVEWVEVIRVVLPDPVSPTIITLLSPAIAFTIFCLAIGKIKDFRMGGGEERDEKEEGRAEVIYDIPLNMGRVLFSF